MPFIPIQQRDHFRMHNTTEGIIEKQPRTVGIIIFERTDEFSQTLQASWNFYMDSQRISIELTFDDPFYYRLLSPNHEEKFPAELLIICKSTGSRLRDERRIRGGLRVADVTMKAPMS